MSRNIQRLGETLSDRMKKTSSAAVPTTAELGTINANLSLTPDSLMSPIPRGEYMVNKALSVGAGMRVLIIWCGNEPVVAAAVVAS